MMSRLGRSRLTAGGINADGSGVNANDFKGLHGPQMLLACVLHMASCCTRAM